MNKEYDASHMLAPMPLAISLGVGSNAMPMNVATIQNINGQAITLAIKHKDKRDPKNWKGFKFAVPFEYSMHNFLLRYYVAEHGLDPDKDIQIRVMPPPEMVANLRAGNIDGFLGPDPFNQRAVFDEVGFIHILTQEIWDGHPCCAFGVPERNSSRRIPTPSPRCIAPCSTAAAMAREPEEPRADRQGDRAGQLPEPARDRARAGADRQVRRRPGQREERARPRRLRPRAWQAMAVWMLTQMKRWGYLKGDVNYKQIAEKVYLLTDAKKRMKEAGHAGARRQPYKKIIVMGKEFDPAKPDEYVDSFAIKQHLRRDDDALPQPLKAALLSLLILLAVRRLARSPRCRTETRAAGRRDADRPSTPS